MDRRSWIILLILLFILISIPVGIYLVFQTQIFKPRAGGGGDEQIIAYDNLKRTNNTTSLGTADSGHIWVAEKGVWGISNNLAYSVTSCPASGYATINTGLVDGTYQVRVPVNKQDMLLPFRFVDNNNLYQITNAGPLYRLEKKVNGVVTQIAQSSGITPANDDIISIKLLGDQITVTIYPSGNSIKTFSATDSSLKGTKYGFGNWCNNTVRFTDFLFVGNLASIPSPSPTPSPTPSTDNNTSYDMKVLVIKYFPLTPDQQNIDINVTGDVGDSYTIIRQRTIDVTNALKTSLEKASTYLGYKDSSAQPALRYSVIDTKEYTQAFPIQAGSTNKPDLNKVLSDHNICNYVDNLRVSEVWLWAYQGSGTPKLNISESQLTAGTQFNNVVSDFANGPYYQVPRCQNSYRIYTFNYNSHTSNALESWGHQMEHDLDLADTWGLFGLFRYKFQGPNYPQKFKENGRCGSVHNPPNARSEYDRNNPIPQKSDCLDWNPDSLGQLTDISCSNWGCQAVDLTTNEPHLNYQIWMWQNLPGRKNTKIYQGKQLRNLWDVHGNFDQVMTNSRSVFIPTSSPSPSPSASPFPSPSPIPSSSLAPAVGIGVTPAFVNLASPSSSPTKPPISSPIIPSPSPIPQLTSIYIGGQFIDPKDPKPAKLTIDKNYNRVVFYVQLFYTNNFYKEFPIAFVYNPPATPTPSPSPIPTPTPSPTPTPTPTITSIKFYDYEMNLASGGLALFLEGQKGRQETLIVPIQIKDSSDSIRNLSIAFNYTPIPSLTPLPTPIPTLTPIPTPTPTPSPIPTITHSPTPLPTFYPTPRPSAPSSVLPIPAFFQTITIGTKNKELSQQGSPLALNLAEDAVKERDESFSLSVSVGVKYIIKFIYKPPVRPSFSASCENGVLTANWPKVEGAVNYELRGARSIYDRPDDPTWNSIPISEKIVANQYNKCNQTSCSFRTEEKSTGNKFLSGEIYYLWFHSRNANGQLSEATKLPTPIICTPTNNVPPPPVFTNVSCQNGTLSLAWKGGGPRYEIRVANGLSINQVLDPNIWGKSRPNQLDIAENDYEGNSVSYNVGSNAQQYTIWIHSNDNNVLSDRIFYPFYLRCN